MNERQEMTPPDGAARRENWDDVRVGQIRDRLGFSIETLNQLGGYDQVGPQDFDGHITCEFQITGRVYFCKTAGAEEGAKLVR